MLAFRLCRITATLFHRAYFLLLADFLIGSRWFVINGFTGLIDLIFGSSYDALWSLTDPQTLGAGSGFLICWLIVHFLSTKQIWFNGVVVELFVIVQLLGYLSNLAFTTPGQFQPLPIAVALYFLVDHYRYYIQQLRLQDPEQTFYALSHLRKPFVPRRALQIIQVTPVLYSILHVTRNRFDEANYFRLKYSLGMADAIVYVAINLDFGLAVLTRVVGSVRHLYQHFAWKNIGFLIRFNISGSYNYLISDFGWKSVPADQLHVAWIIYWCFKMILIGILYVQLELPELTFLQFVAAELFGNYVAATATVYLACLVTGFVISAFATIFTFTADIMSCSSVCQSSYDTVQHIRWMALSSLLCPPNHLRVLLHALLYAHLPLCGKMIQNVGEVVRRRCCCSDRSWMSVIGGTLAIAGFMVYSCAVFLFISIGSPNVSPCFGYTIDMMSAVWLLYNSLITILELVTIVVYQGLVDESSRRNLDRGTRVYRNCMAVLLALSLTVVNVYSFGEIRDGGLAPPCGYKDTVLAVLQIFSRLVFLWLTVKRIREGCSVPRALCSTDTFTLHRGWSQQRTATCRDLEAPCGLCYNYLDTMNLLRLHCGHSFHKACFSSWRNCGSRCPVCRIMFRRPDILLAYYNDGS
ncbi:hypothetical protein BV898_11813 [Hypsibius exemplaris]|uniref:RING-type domain-containing protein n=1 Tax=Hypsibius exemplaris TaxID=2072580 RepID=A0A1W0WFF8_HYPEX|nr:hypothetical protein BV898_11813 [Hypsibius exemplaris]